MIQESQIIDNTFNTMNSQQLGQSQFKMKINDAHIITQKQQKIALKSMQISPNQFDVEFQSSQQGTKLYSEIVFQNLTEYGLVFRIRCNNPHNYKIYPTSKFLIPKHMSKDSKKQRDSLQKDYNTIKESKDTRDEYYETIKISVNNPQNVNFLHDKIQIQVIVDDHINNLPDDRTKVWNKEFMINCQMEEQIMCFKVNNKELQKIMSPKKSIQKQNFISQYFHGNPQQNNLINSQHSIQSSAFQSSPSVFGGKSLTQSQQPVFSMKLNSLKSPIMSNSKQQNGNSLVNTVYSTQNANYNMHGSNISGDTNDIVQQQQQYLLNQQSQKQQQQMQQEVNQDLKQQYEQLLIHVDQQEKSLSQLDEEKKIFQEQLENIQNINGRSDFNNKKGDLGKDKKNKNKNNSNNEINKIKIQGVQIWKVIIYFIALCLLGWYTSQYNISTNIQINGYDNTDL